jgi:anti-sigma regulatory factor (Ser/Thr protein kinase)
MSAPLLTDPAPRFRHEAFFYAEDAAYVAGTVPFLREGLQVGAALLVAVGADKIDLLRAELGADSARVEFVDMRVLGRNPATIIPAWQAFIDQHAIDGRPVRGIGEPVWPGRNEAALVECHHHEALLNVAFDGGPAWSLLCPYDTSALRPDTIATACGTHPGLRDQHGARRSDRYCGGAHPEPDHLPPAPPDALEVRFDRDTLRDTRATAAAAARRMGLSPARVEDLTLVVSELVTNSLRHGSGRGVLRVWSEAGTVMCDIADRGRITDPLAGRRRPTACQPGGRGLWLANRLCDLVQIRSSGAGPTVRVHLSDGA